MRVGIGVLEQVDGVAGRCFPREHFNEAVTVDVDGAVRRGWSSGWCCVRAERVFAKPFRFELISCTKSKA